MFNLIVIATSLFSSPWQFKVGPRHGPLSLRAKRGNPVAVATAVPRRVFDLIEIATSLRSSQ